MLLAQAMPLAQKNEIRHLPKKQYGMPPEMCRHANRPANVAKQHIRHFREYTGKYLSYEKNWKISMLQARDAEGCLHYTVREIS